ncbi:MAG: hypothetical protein ACK5DE_13985 [Bacteroidota bacterium]
MDERFIQALYNDNNLSELGSFDEFKVAMQNPAFQSEFHKSYLSSMGTLEEFQSALNRQQESLPVTEPKTGPVQMPTPASPEQIQKGEFTQPVQEAPGFFKGLARQAKTTFGPQKEKSQILTELQQAPVDYKEYINKQRILLDQTKTAAPVKYDLYQSNPIPTEQDFNTMSLDQIKKKYGTSKIANRAAGLLADENRFTIPVSSLLDQLSDVPKEQQVSTFNNLVNDALRKVREQQVYRKGQLEYQMEQETAGIPQTFGEAISRGELGTYAGSAIGGAAGSSAVALTRPLVGGYELTKGEILDMANKAKAESLGQTENEFIISGGKLDSNAAVEIGSLVSSALEYVGLGKIASPLFKNLVKEGTKSAIKKGLVEVGKGAATEFSTEFVQSVNEQVSSQMAAGKKPEEIVINWDDALESGIQGGIGGGGLTTVSTVTSGLIDAVAKKRKVEQIDNDINRLTDTGNPEINQQIDNEVTITAPTGDLISDQEKQIGVPSAEQQGAATIQEGPQPEGRGAETETGGIFQVSPEAPGAQAEVTPNIERKEIEVYRGTTTGNKSEKDGVSYYTPDRNYAAFYESGTEKAENKALQELQELKEPIKPTRPAPISEEEALLSAKEFGYTFKSIDEFKQKIKEIDSKIKSLTPEQLNSKEGIKLRNDADNLALIELSPEKTESTYRSNLQKYEKDLAEYNKRKSELETKAQQYLSPKKLTGNFFNLGVDFSEMSPRQIFDRLKTLGIATEFKGGNFLDNYHSDLTAFARKNNIDFFNGIKGGIVGSINIKPDEIIEVSKIEGQAPTAVTPEVTPQVEAAKQVPAATVAPQAASRVTPQVFDAAKVSSPENLTAIETNSKAEIDKTTALPTADEGGATFNLDGTTYTGGGVVVPVTSVNLTKAEMTPQRIAQFVKDNAAKIGADNVKVGIYKFPNQDKYSVDLNIVVPQEFQQQGLDFARAAGQESIFDLTTFDNIKTGATGMTPATFTDEQFKQIAADLAQGKVPQIASAEVTAERQKAEQELESALGVTPVSERNESEIQDAVDSAQAVLKSMGVSIVSVPTIEEYNKTAEREGADTETEGMFISDKGVIYINTELIVKGITGKRVIWHEATHPILNIIQNTDKALYNKVVDGLYKAAEQNKDLKEVSEWAKSYGDDATVDNEFLTEVIARIADGTIDISNLKTGLKQALIDLINKIAKALGLGQVLSDTDIIAFKGLATQISEVLVKGKDAAEIVGKENLDQYGSSLGSPVQLKKVEVSGQKILKRTGEFPLSFVKSKDIIDIKKLLKDISNKNQKVWFWTADQLGRGMYYDKVIGSSHYLDAGPSFALDPENRKNKRIWATGKSENWVNQRIENSDYIFIISGSPLKSKLFNKRVAEITVNRIKAVAKTEDAWNVFKNEVLDTSKISALNEILNKYNSFEDLIKSPDRKEFLILVEAQKEKKGTPLKATLEKYNAFVDYNEIRDGFYRENDFQLNDIMLVLKPKGFGGKSAHSTYENDLLGEVVGVPDTKINAFDIMPDDFKAKYSSEITRTEQSQAVAPYGAGIRKIQYSRSSKANPINKTDGDMMTGTPYEKHITSDNKGNFIFFHTTSADYKDIKPGLDSRKFYSTRTSRDEKALQYGVASYYTKPTDSEPMVLGDSYYVKVPMSKVYPMNTDPNGYEAQAEQNIPKNEPFRYEKVRKEMARLAKDDGYQMAVAYWGLDEKRGSVRRGMLALRGDALVPLKPKPFVGAEDFNVGPQYSKRKLTDKNKASVTRALVKVGEDMIKTGEATIDNVIEKLRNFTKGKYALDISGIENDILSAINVREAVRSQEFNVNNSVEEFTNDQVEIDEEESFGTTELVDKMASYLAGKVTNSSQVKRFVDEWNKQNPDKEVKSTEVWNKIDGKPVDEQMISTTLTKIIQEKERTKKLAGKDAVKQFKDIVQYIRDAVKGTKLTWSQTKAILSKLKGITYLTPERTAKVKTYVDKVVADAKVAQKIHYAEKLRKKLKKAPTKTAAPIKAIAKKLASIEITDENIDEFIIHASSIINSYTRPDRETYAGVRTLEIEVFIDNESRRQENELTAALLSAAEESEAKYKSALTIAEAYNNPTEQVNSIDDIVDEQLNLSEEKKRITRENLIAIATGMRNMLRDFPTIPGRAKEKAALERFNPTTATLDTIVQYIKVVNNAILNNNFAGTGRIIASINAQSNVNQAIAAIKANRRVISALGRFGRVYTKFASNVAATYDKLMGGKDAAIEFLTYIGLADYLEKNAQFIEEKNEIQRLVDAKITEINDKYKVNVLSEENQIKRRVLSELAKYVNDPTASVPKVIRNIEADIKELLANNNPELTPIADQLYELLNDMRSKGALNYNVAPVTDPITGNVKFQGYEFSDGDITGSSHTVQGYFEKNHPAVYELWDYNQKIYNQKNVFNRASDINERFYNELMTEYKFYSATVFRKVGEGIVSEDAYPVNSLRPAQSNRFKEATRSRKAGYTYSYIQSFTDDMNALFEVLHDIYTTESQFQFAESIVRPELIDPNTGLFTGQKRDFVIQDYKRRTDIDKQAAREKLDELALLLDTGSRVAKNIANTTRLFSVKQVIAQWLPAYGSLVAILGNKAPLLHQTVPDSFDDVLKLTPAALRSAEESFLNLNNKFNLTDKQLQGYYGKAFKALGGVEKGSKELSSFMLKYPIGKPDFNIYKRGWVALYTKSLMDQGVTDVNLETENTMQEDPRRVKARYTATFEMTKLMAASDPASKTQLSKSRGYLAALVGVMMPFSAFQLNYKDRIITALYKIKSKEGMVELGAALTESLVFASISVAWANYITDFVATYMAENLLGIDLGDDEEGEEETLFGLAAKTVSDIATRMYLDVNPMAISYGENVMLRTANFIEWLSSDTMLNFNEWLADQDEEQPLIRKTIYDPVGYPGMLREDLTKALTAGQNLYNAYVPDQGIYVMKNKDFPDTELYMDPFLYELAEWNAVMSTVGLLAPNEAKTAWRKVQRKAERLKAVD